MSSPTNHDVELEEAISAGVNTFSIDPSPFTGSCALGVVDITQTARLDFSFLDQLRRDLQSQSDEMAEKTRELLQQMQAESDARRGVGSIHGKISDLGRIFQLG